MQRARETREVFLCVKKFFKRSRPPSCYKDATFLSSEDARCTGSRFICIETALRFRWDEPFCSTLAESVNYRGQVNFGPSHLNKSSTGGFFTAKNSRAFSSVEFLFVIRGVSRN